LAAPLHALLARTCARAAHMPACVVFLWAICSTEPSTMPSSTLLGVRRMALSGRSACLWWALVGQCLARRGSATAQPHFRGWWVGAGVRLAPRVSSSVPVGRPACFYMFVCVGWKEVKQLQVCSAQMKVQKQPSGPRSAALLVYSPICVQSSGKHELAPSLFAPIARRRRSAAAPRAARATRPPAAAAPRPSNTASP
jgi:hypothetical protein